LRVFQTMKRNFRKSFLIGSAAMGLAMSVLVI
jgi:hypothetical protein